MPATATAAMQDAMTKIVLGSMQMAAQFLWIFITALWPLWAMLGVLLLIKMLLRFAALEVGARRGWNLFWFWHD